MTRTRGLKFPLFLGLALILGCNRDNSRTLGGGGNGGGGGSTDDTTNEGTSGSSPEIVNVSAGFENYPSYGWVIEVKVEYSDEDDDIESGMVYLEITDQYDELDEFDLRINGQDAFVDDGQIIFAIQDVSTSGDYTLGIQLEDAAGNVSAPWEETVGR